MPKASQQMGAAIQLQSKESIDLSETTPPNCTTHICRHLPRCFGSNQQSWRLRYGKILMPLQKQKYLVRNCFNWNLVLGAGFKVSNTSCCNVASLGGLCLPNSKLCKNRTEFVFWDAFHPSDAANAVLADRIFPTVFSQSHSPSPAPSSGGRPHHPHHPHH